MQNHDDIINKHVIITRAKSNECMVVKIEDVLTAIHSLNLFHRNDCKYTFILSLSIILHIVYIYIYIYLNEDSQSN